MEGGENARAAHREDRHRFRSAVDGRPPVLSSEEQNRRNQRSGVTNTNPEHEVGDVPTPENRVGHAPHTDTCGNQQGQTAADTEQSDQCAGEKQNPPK